MIILDYETTGLLKPSASELALQPHITDIYAIKLTKDFEFIDEFETLVKPPCPIPEDIVKITNITDEMVAGAPSFLDLYDEYADFFLGEDTIIAHNCSFEIGCTYYELLRHDLALNFPWPKNHICTVERTKHLQGRRLKLGKLHELATGQPLINAHRARPDVLGLIRCLEWLVEKRHIKL